VRNLTKIMTVGIMGCLMMWGSGVRGDVTVDTEIVKVGGAVSGTHGTLPDSTWTASGTMSGPGAGTVGATATAFSGNAGDEPSEAVCGTKVTITYTKDGEDPIIAGSDTLTVVEVILSQNGSAINNHVVAPNGTLWYFATITFSGTANPIGLGDVTVTATPSGGIWAPNPATMSVSAGAFSGLMTTDYLTPNISPVSIFMSFSIVATYAGITSNSVQEILVN